MSPSRLVKEAVVKGIQVLALTDHNTARNTPTFERICQSVGILPLCGLEITTVEELHCLALFSTSQQAIDMGILVESLLPRVLNRPEKWGDQVVVDEEENITAEVEIFLGSATSLSLSELGQEIHRRGGLFIPAHIDRASQSIFSQIGYLPQLPYDALEIRKFPPNIETGHTTLVYGSDAHYPENVGQRTCWIDCNTHVPSFFASLKTALKTGLVQLNP